MTRALLLTLVLVAGCAKSAPPPSCPLPAKQEETLSARKDACAALTGHLVELGVNAYVLEEGLHPSKKEYALLVAQWESSLRESGKLARVEHMCLAQMERAQLDCAAKAQSLEQVNGCFE